MDVGAFLAVRFCDALSDGNVLTYPHHRFGRRAKVHIQRNGYAGRSDIKEHQRLSPGSFFSSGGMDSTEK